jgi:hypothetical protein
MKTKFIRNLMTVLVVTPFLYSFLNNYLLPFQAFLSFNTATDNIFSKLETAKNYKIVKALQNLANLPLSEKKKTLLFIPQSNRLYWDLQKQCYDSPLFAPAITGIAMIDGLPGVDCYVGNYIYESYQLRKEPQSSLDKTKETLCQKALAKGFSQVIVIDVDPNHNILQSNLSCS